MNGFVLRVPSSGRLNDWHIFISSSLKSLDNYDIVVVDFGVVCFLETDDFVALACLIERFYQLGAEIQFSGGSNKLNKHLDNIKFKEYWKPHFDRKKFTACHNTSTLCLWKISEEMIMSYSEYAKGYFERFDTTKDLTPLGMNIGEVFNNIFDHSKSLVDGYIMSQYFPRINTISFAVCDFGVGIPYTVNGKLRKDGHETISDGEAIYKSLEHGFSAESVPNNRGFGLNNLLELTESSNGNLRIVSSRGILEKRFNREYQISSLMPEFKGTLIRVDLDLNTFETKEEESYMYGF